jgi:hypothetical protein
MGICQTNTKQFKVGDIWKMQDGMMAVIKVVHLHGSAVAEYQTQEDGPRFIKTFDSCGNPVEGVTTGLLELIWRVGYGFVGIYVQNHKPDLHIDANGSNPS